MINYIGDILAICFVIGSLYGLYLVYQRSSVKEQFYDSFIKYSILFSVVSAVGSIMLYPMSHFGIMFRLSLYSIFLFIAFANITFLSVAFKLMDRHFHYRLLRFFFVSGILMTFVTSYIYNSSNFHFIHIDNYSVVPVAFAVFICEIIGVVSVMCLAFIIEYFTGRRPKGITTNKTSHYYAAGLSEKEIVFFREQMAVAKQNIHTIEQEFNKTAKLKAIEVRHNTIVVSKNYFKELVAEPNKLTQASLFLYKLLPSLEDLLQKYNEVNNHVAKNKQTYLILEKSATTIEQICAEINDNYIQFHREDYDNLLDEIQLAKRNLTRATEQNNTSDDPVADILNETAN